MLNKCEFHNVPGGYVFAFNDVTSPLNTFDVSVIARTDTSRNKMEQQGVNPTRPYRGGMEIHLEGAMFQDTTALYTAYRKTCALALYGNPATPPNPLYRTNGYLLINLDGETEDWQTDCVVTAYTNPIKGLYPTLSEFAVTLFSWTPWFIGSSSGLSYYWS